MTAPQPHAFNLAIKSSSDKNVAYVSVLGKPDTTITVSARDEANLVRLLWNKYKLAPCPKKCGIFRGSI